MRMAHMSARTGSYRYVNSERFQTMPFRVDMAGFDRCAPDYYLSRVNSPISVVGYTLRGTGSVSQNGKTLPAEKGSLFLVNQGDSSCYYPGFRLGILLGQSAGCLLAGAFVPVRIGSDRGFSGF